MMPNYDVTLVDYDPELFHIATPLHEEIKSTLQAVGATFQIGRCQDEEAVLAMACKADLVMIQSVRPLLTGRVIRQLSRCRGLIRMGLGYDSVDVATATEVGIPVSNVVDWCTDEVAEHTMALLLAGARRVARLSQGMRAQGWPRQVAQGVVRLAGKAVGIIGFGRVGRAVAKRLVGFGVSVLVYDPHVDAAVVQRFGAEMVTLDELLARADFISIHARLTAESYHLLGARQFALMKKGVFIVNTSRGQVIDEQALIAALEAGRVAGASLDVMEEEPLPADSPLRCFPNVDLTPHVASYSVEAVGELYRQSAQIAAQLLTGVWVPTIVNPEVRPKAEARWGRYRCP